MLGSSWRIDQFQSVFDAIAHRGPDASGYSVLKSGCLGMHRLQLRGSDVPLPVLLGEDVCAFNGQIYGCIDIEGGLFSIQDGIENEILVALRGNPDGMFAGAILNSDRQRLSLFSDSYFNKPLFYLLNDNDVAFCSEMNPLIGLIDHPSINVASIADLFHYGWYLGSDTWINGLHGLMYRNLEIENHVVKEVPKTYKVPKVNPVERVRDMVRDSLIMCLRGSGPFGLALSGGLDSTILAYELNDLGFEDLTTISFLSKSGNDGIRDLKSLGLKRNGAWEKWKHVVVENFDDSELYSAFFESVEAFAHPTSMSSLPLTWLVAKKAKEHGIRVMLSGEGVDELFCGYNSYSKIESKVQIFDYYKSQGRQRCLSLLFDSRTSDESWSRFSDKYAGCDDLRLIEKDLRLSRLLLRNDVCFMHHTIETRTPFLHQGVPELAMSIPWSQAAVWPGKKILRETWGSHLGGRAMVSKVRFKMDDYMVRSMFNSNEIRELVLNTTSDYFRGRRVEECVMHLMTPQGFDHDIASLLISLGILINKKIV